MRPVIARVARARWLGGVGFDSLLAGALVIYAQLDVWTHVTNERVPGAKPVASAGLVLATLPLAWRRRHPLAVLCVVMSAIAGEAVIAGGAPEGGEVLFPTLIALYSVAAYAQIRKALIGLAIAWTASAIHGIKDPALLSFGDLVLVDLFFFWFLGGGAWLAGRYVRSRRHQVTDFERQTARLEREREERARVAVAQERSRIARELHDVVSHGVSLMGVQAAGAEQVLAHDPERAREPLRLIQREAREAVAELGRLLSVLRDPSDMPSGAPQPGLAQVEALVDHVRAAGLPVALELEGEGPLPAGIELSAYRIVQEALTNVLKHAQADRAEVLVRRGRRALEVQIADDGVGTANGSGSGHGLVGMRERVALYGGTVEAGPRAEGGYIVRARLPLGIGR